MPPFIFSGHNMDEGLTPIYRQVDSVSPIAPWSLVGITFTPVPPGATPGPGVTEPPMPPGGQDGDLAMIVVDATLVTTPSLWNLTGGTNLQVWIRGWRNIPEMEPVLNFSTSAGALIVYAIFRPKYPFISGNRFVYGGGQNLQANGAGQYAYPGIAAAAAQDEPLIITASYKKWDYFGTPGPFTDPDFNSFSYAGAFQPQLMGTYFWDQGNNRLTSFVMGAYVGDNNSQPNDSTGIVLDGPDPPTAVNFSNRGSDGRSTRYNNV